MLGAGERADVDVPAPRVAQAQAARGVDEALGERVGELAPHVHAGHVDPRLARVGEGGPQRAVHGVAERRVGEHEHRVAAVGADAHDASGAALLQRRGQVGAAGGHAYEALGDAGALERPHQAHGGQGHERVGHEHDAVAGHERVGHPAHAAGPGRAPRRGHADDADRVAHEVRALAPQRQLVVAQALVGQVARRVGGDPAQRVDRGEDLHRDRLGARAALLAGQQLAERVDLVEHDLRDAAQVARAVRQRQRGPERLHGVHLGHDVRDGLGRGLGHLAEDGAGAGVVAHQSGHRWHPRP